MVPRAEERRTNMKTASKRKLTRERIHEVLWNAVAKETDRDRAQIHPEHRAYQDLGLDSLGAVQIHLELEAELDTSIPDDVLENSEATMGQLEAALCERLLW
jgi:acyl carrier protein